jgi:hypothetical protein
MLAGEAEDIENPKEILNSANFTQCQPSKTSAHNGAPVTVAWKSGNLIQTHRINATLMLNDA